MKKLYLLGLCALSGAQLFACPTFNSREIADLLENKQLIRNQTTYLLGTPLKGLRVSDEIGGERFVPSDEQKNMIEALRAHPTWGASNFLDKTRRGSWCPLQVYDTDMFPNPGEDDTQAVIGEFSAGEFSPQGLTYYLKRQDNWSKTNEDIQESSRKFNENIQEGVFRIPNIEDNLAQDLTENPTEKSYDFEDFEDFE